MLSAMLENKNIIKIEQNIRRKVLWPLTIVIIGSLAIFLFVSNYYLEIGLTRTQEKQLQTLTSRYHNYMQERTGLMRSLLQQLGRDTLLIEALGRRDRDFLFQHSTPLFTELLTEQHITHFYFHTPEGTNLLRVHKPERHGDLIDRVTLHLAQRNNKIADGIELGPLGTFTLRVVMPVHDHDRLVGYIELGQDIDPILEHLAADGGDHLTLLIQKQYLDREAWLEGRNMLGETGVWDFLSDHVISGLTILEDVDFLPEIVTTQTLKNSETVEVILDNKIHRGRFLNMMDAAGRSVGSLLVLQDVNAILMDYEASIWLIGIFCFLLAAVLFFISAVFLGRVDQSLREIKEQLTEEITETEEAPKPY